MSSEVRQKGARQGHAPAMSPVEPWPEEVDGQGVADAVQREVRRYVVLPSGADVAIVLWLMHAHAIDAFRISPILAVTSPEKRCGKSTLIDVVSRLAPRAVVASNVTPSTLFRVIEKYAPCILIDEADTFLRTNRELVGVLNSGQNRAGAYVLRGVGDDYEPRAFTTWAPKVLAAIGNLPPTIEDRSIVVRMRRRLQSEPVERLRLDRPERFDLLRRQLARWAADNVEFLRLADPIVPSELNDRAADNWRPLLAISESLGAEWAARAREASLALSALGEPEQPPHLRMLGDVRAIFRREGKRRITSAELVELLHREGDGHWAEWSDGQGITQNFVAKLLKQYGISSCSVAVGASSARGYRLEDFSDAFRRYLPAEPREVRGARDYEPSLISSQSEEAEV